MKTQKLIPVLILLTSCIQELPLDIPDWNHPVVVTGILNPEEQISLNIATLSLFSETTGPDSPNVLEISIFEDNSLVKTLVNPGTNIISTIYPKVGSNYNIFVRTDKDTLLAKTGIPTKVFLEKADYWYSDVASQRFDRLTEASITWSDSSGYDNFYEVLILYSDMRPLSYYQFDQIDDPVIQQECDLNYEPSSFVFSDKQFAGKSYSLSLKFGIGGSETKPNRAYVVFRSVSEEYYHFRKSWHKHVYLQNNFTGDEANLDLMDIYKLLFQGDPISLYSNIEGGLGIFAAYNQEIREFKFIQ